VQPDEELPEESVEMEPEADAQPEEGETVIE
jgi:hypothetical protein